MSDRHIGIDVGGTEIKWSVIADGTVILAGRNDTPRSGGEELIDLIALIATGTGGPIAGIGLAFPGTIDTVRRQTMLIPNIPGDWEGFPIAETLELRTDTPVAVINDARAFAYGELIAGAALDQSRALFVTLGTGVGGAVALDGRILIGKNDSIGEVGHILVDQNGEFCICGGRGCLETVASASAIVGRLSRSVAMGQSPILAGLCAGEPARLSARIAAQAAEAGDPWATDAFDRAGRALGSALGTVCMLLQIPTIVVGGGMASALPLLRPAMQTVLDTRQSISGPITVRAGVFGTEAGSVGAALFAAANTRTTAFAPIERNPS